MHENFAKTAVIRGASTMEFCIKENENNTKPDPKPIDLDDLIELYKTFYYTHSYEHFTPSSPMKQSGVLSINDYQELPLFLRAQIRSHHIRNNPDAVLGHDADAQMKVMGQLPTDVRACLLPHSLGGSRGSNVVPMAENVYRLNLTVIDTANITDVDISKPPLSSWKSNENWILRFLQTYPDGLVIWSVAVQYEQGLVPNPRRRRDYRPVAFGRRLLAYRIHDDGDSMFYETDQTTFLNNNDDTCGGLADEFPPIPDMCSQMTIPKGVSAAMSRNVWDVTYIVSLPYKIGQRTFFYGQCVMDGRRWYIQELLPYGQMGEKTSMGDRDFYYWIAFTYSISDKHFLYSHRGRGGTYWFIQELLPGGQMGSKITDGNWAYSHSVSIPFSIKGRHFFYGQIVSINKWFIQELLPGGKMGKVTGYGADINPVVFLYKGNSTYYLYSHEPLRATWCIRELLPEGKLGWENITSGNWTETHHTSVPYTIKGETYFFGVSLYTGFWFVQELNGTGHMGERLDQGTMTERYQVIFTYASRGKHYVYGHNQRTKEWIIRRLR